MCCYRWTVIVSIIATLFGCFWLCGWLWFGSTKDGRKRLQLESIHVYIVCWGLLVFYRYPSNTNDCAICNREHCHLFEWASLSWQCSISLLQTPTSTSSRCGLLVCIYAFAFAFFPTGIGHGVRRSITSLGSVLGSLWAGGALHENSIVLLYGMPIGLLLLAIVSINNLSTYITLIYSNNFYIQLLTVMSFRKLDTSRLWNKR